MYTKPADDYSAEVLFTNDSFEKASIKKESEKNLGLFLCNGLRLRKKKKVI